MIRNDREYRHATEQLASLESELEKLSSTPLSEHDDGVAAVVEALEMQIEDIKREADEFEDLKEGRPPTFEAGNLDSLGELITKARIAQGLSQTDLAEKLSTTQQQVQRYERDGWQKISLWRLSEVIEALSLDLDVRAQVGTIDDTHPSSVIEKLTNAQPVELVGEGELQLQPGQDEPPDGPGRVRFALRYTLTENGRPHTQAIKVGLEALDEGAREILGWNPGERGRPMPRYDLRGTVEVGGNRVSARVEPVLIDYNLPPDFHSVFEADLAWKVTAGPGAEADPVRVRALIPNLAVPNVSEFEVEGLRVRLYEAYPEAEAYLRDPENAGKVLPGSHLDIELLEGAEENNIPVAIEVFGWLLSFYAGRSVHPVAWEVETEEGPAWCVRAQDVTPLPVQERTSCLGRDNLSRFLEEGFRSWLGRAETERARLRGAINSYREILAAPFATQQVALTAMYLERFRELFVGSSELLEGSNSRRENFAKEITEALKLTIGSNDRLEPNEKELLISSLNTNRGKVKDLFRKTFKESLLELYSKADLAVNDGELGMFIAERNRVIHGSWNASPEVVLKNDQLARYGLSLLERLLLRLLGYEGEYYDRANNEMGWLPKGDPTL